MSGSGSSQSTSDSDSDSGEIRRRMIDAGLEDILETEPGMVERVWGLVRELANRLPRPQAISDEPSHVYEVADSDQRPPALE